MNSFTICCQLYNPHSIDWDCCGSWGWDFLKSISEFPENHPHCRNWEAICKAWACPGAIALAFVTRFVALIAIVVALIAPFVTLIAIVAASSRIVVTLIAIVATFSGTVVTLIAIVATFSGTVTTSNRLVVTLIAVIATSSRTVATPGRIFALPLHSFLADGHPLKHKESRHFKNTGTLHS